ncbi:TetR/AcrR family transcriptional regulator [Nitratidesulfovibrio sp. D1]|uniref:TetR/AcrR family transcriptional regulator n=1 Tax=Nitratidesulfovibrio sp. D1 TaxID=3440151 RepID=UPI003EB89AC4
MSDHGRTAGRQDHPRRASPPDERGRPNRPNRPDTPHRQDCRDRQDQGTRERLLAAAAEVFAEHGYKSATVREICRRAGANVAAVNYHFGGKDRLYAAMLDHYMRTCQATFPLDVGVTPESTPEERLRAFVHGLVLRVLGGGDDPVSEAHGKLVSLEMINPGPASDALIREHIVPVNNLLDDILRGLLGPAADDPEVLRTCLLAIFGHITFYFNGRGAIAHIYGREDPTPESLERIVDGVVRFTMGGIATMSGAQPPARAHGPRHGRPPRRTVARRGVDGPHRPM